MENYIAEKKRVLYQFGVPEDIINATNWRLLKTEIQVDNRAHQILADYFDSLVI